MFVCRSTASCMYSPMMVMAPPAGYSMRSPYMTTADMTAAKIYAQNQANKDFSQLPPKTPTAMERGEGATSVHNRLLKFMKTNNIVNILCMAPRMVYCSIINLLWSLMSKMSTTFRSVSYGPCSRTGFTCVASDFGEI